MSILERKEHYQLIDESASLVDDPWELLQKLARETPLLSREEEVVLGQRIRAGIRCEGKGLSGTRIVEETPDSREALDQLVTANLKLVLKEARAWERWGNPEKLLKYAQQGIVGLTLAALRFDPDRGCKFSTAATRWIQNAIRQDVEDGDGRKLPRREFVMWMKIQKQMAIANRDGMNLDGAIRTTAEKMGIEEEEVRILLKAKEAQGSLQEFVVVKDKEGQELEERLPANNVPTETIVVNRELTQLALEILKRDDLFGQGEVERGRLLLLLSAGLVGRGLTLEEIGVLFGMSRQAVGQQKDWIAERAKRIAKGNGWDGEESIGKPGKKRKKKIYIAEREDLMDLSAAEKKVMKLIESDLKMKEVARTMGLTENRAEQLLTSAKVKKQMVQEDKMVRTLAAGMIQSGRE